MNSAPSRDSGQANVASATSADAMTNPRMCKRAVDRRPISRGERPVERVGVLVGNATPDPVPHQHGRQRDREPCSGGHGVGLGKGERREQTPLLRFQREDRQERQRDDQETEE